MSRTSRREMRALLEIAGRRTVPERADDAIRFAPTVPITDGNGVGNGIGNGNGAAPVTSDDLRSLLTLAGSRPVPEPDPAFLAETESRILNLDRDRDDDRRVSAALLADDSLDELSVPRERKVRRPALLTGAAAAVVVLVIVGALTGLYGGGGGGGANSDLALVTAVDTVVVLPDGTRVEGARGVELPDGTIIRTGPHGRATIAGVHLGPDTEAVVRNGRLRIIGDDATSQLPAGGGTGTDVVPPPAVPGGGGTTSGGPSGSSGGSTGGGSGASGSGETPTSSPPPAPPISLPPISLPPISLPPISLPPLNELLPLL